MDPTILSTDISPIAGRTPFKLHASYFQAASNKKNITLLGLPGGGLSAKYFDLTPTHSFAKDMTARGYSLLTLDLPGTAGNPLPDDHPFLTPRQSSDYIAQALRAYDLSAQRLIGIGHSLGGMMLSLLQARHQICEAIALLGSNAGGLEWGLSETEKAYIGQADNFARDLEPLTLAKFKTPFPENFGGARNGSITFGGETPDLTQALKDIGCELYAAGGLMSMVAGSFQSEVQAINVPIFLGVGDHDIGIPAKEAAQAYIHAPAIELCTLEKTGHNHFAFSTLHTLCARLDHWVAAL